MLCESTFLLRPSSFDSWNTWKIILFISLSLSLYPILSPSPVSFLSFLLFPSLSHRIPLFCLFPSHFLISHFLLFLSFSLFFLFLVSFPSFSHLDCINWMVQKWGKLPPTFLHYTCHHHVFLPYFLYFLFSLLLHHVTHCSM